MQTERIPILIKALFIADLAVALLHVLNILIGEPHPSVTRLVDLNGEGNLPTWYSASQLLLIAFLVGVLAVVEREGSQGQFRVILTAGFAFVLLSLDEVAQIHERFGWASDYLLPGHTRLGTAFWRTGIWMFLLGLVAIIAAVCFIRRARAYLTEYEGVLHKLILGAAILIGSATVPEALYNFPNERLWLEVLVVVEETGEMIGETFLVWGCLVLVVSRLKDDGCRLELAD